MIFKGILYISMISFSLGVYGVAVLIQMITFYRSVDN